MSAAVRTLASVAALLAAACHPALAAEPAVYFERPGISDACKARHMSALYLRSAVGRGMPLPQALEVNQANSRRQRLPDVAVREAYEFALVPDEEFAAYQLWRCKAIELDIEFRGLGEVAERLTACATVKGPAKDACLAPVLNLVLGLPEDHVPPSPQSPAVAMPAASAVGRASGAANPR